MSNYVEYAVDSMIAHYAANLEAELVIVETASSLHEGDLTRPDETLDYFAPNETRSPLLQIYDDEGIGEENQLNGQWNVPVAVVFSYSSDASQTGAARFIRRYVTALMRVVIKDPLLSGTVVQAIFNGAEALRVERDQSATRHHYGLGWLVQIDEREAA